MAGNILNATPVRVVNVDEVGGLTQQEVGALIDSRSFATEGYVGSAVSDKVTNQELLNFNFATFEEVESEVTAQIDRIEPINELFVAEKNGTFDIHDTEVFNLSDLFTDHSLNLVNTGALTFSATGSGEPLAAIFPAKTGYTSYSLELRISGNFPTSTTSSRDLIVFLKKADGTMISSASLIKVRDTALRDNSHIQTYTLGITDSFSTAGAILEVLNDSYTDFVLTSARLVLKISRGSI